ncbi:MAG: hypothetical protein FIA97_06630 [Methylococcaceae bacterium]|nr:hypothetical protein [Methylococcaceae bacterium]
MPVKFAITGPTHKGKHIEVTIYRKTASGMEIKITHNIPSSPGKQLRWVQTITENGTFFKACGQSSYVDPFGPDASWTTALPSMPGVCNADDAKPFYETAAEFAASPDFYDRPSESPPATGRTWLNFVTALTEVTGTTVVHLVAVAWGFDRLANGTVAENSVRRPTEAQMKEHGRALKKMYPAYTFT